MDVEYVFTVDLGSSEDSMSEDVLLFSCFDHSVMLCQ